MRKWTRFRPLSRGLFFNNGGYDSSAKHLSFRPLSRGPFFNTAEMLTDEGLVIAVFSSPFSGTFFQCAMNDDTANTEQ